MRYFSPAKINLLLHAGARREDGYHELVTVMQALDFGDTLDIEPAPPGTLRIECDVPGVPTDNSNLVARAVLAFYRETGLDRPGWSIALRKKVPPGSGLGGGSSNAVAMLKALNEYHGGPLEAGRMESLAAELGSDTVFFLEPSTWLLGGRGEKKIREMESRRWSYVLVFPGIGSSTASVYSRYLFDLTIPRPDPSLLESRLKTASTGDIEHCLQNTLQPAIEEEYPRIAEYRRLIERKTSRKVFISGSGSTLFLICDTDEQALVLIRRIESISNGKTPAVLTHTLEYS